MVRERQRRLGQDGSSKGLSERVNVAVIELGTLRGYYDETKVFPEAFPSP